MSTARDIFNSIIDQDNVSASQHIADALLDRSVEKIELMREYVGKSLFQEASDSDYNEGLKDATREDNANTFTKGVRNRIKNPSIKDRDARIDASTREYYKKSLNNPDSMDYGVKLGDRHDSLRNRITLNPSEKEELNTLDKEQQSSSKHAKYLTKRYPDHLPKYK
jgi:hypothetical protein